MSDQKVERVWRAYSNLEEEDHPYMSGPFQPNLEEVNADELKVISGEFPTDVHGIYFRNTEQPTLKPKGNYHPFDGDSMLHRVAFDGEKCSYRNRFVRTEGFLAEQEAKQPLWVGVSEKSIKSARKGWGAEGYLKDTSATDVVVHNGKVLSMFYRCGEAYRLDPETLENLGKDNFAGRFPKEGISAHAKVDEETGELLFFNYSPKAPFMHYGIVNPSDEIVHYVDIPLEAPKLPHDMCFTKNFTILCDLAVQFDEAKLEKGEFKNTVSSKPCRFAILPRYGKSSEVKFFTVRKTFVLHFLNAYEKKDSRSNHDIIVLDGYRQCVYDGPPIPKPDTSWKDIVSEKYHKIFPTFGSMDIMLTKLWRWEFDLTTGETVWEGPIDDFGDRLTEFGVFNQAYAGKEYRYAYSCLLEPGWLLFNGLVKHDLKNGTSSTFKCRPNRFCSEPAFAPRDDPKSEDDGYLVTFVTDMESRTSECVIFDALKIETGPVCRLALPHRISCGTHACWVPERLLKRSKRKIINARSSKL
mmetsp:Transcript_4401/g.5430  ORF Transcript_4401/g.5430 Transcript_4401/m.5430 type:complete len:525 (+) Transcript_4401:114-1688(+)